MNDAYHILGVARDATKEQVKRAYRKLARERHPDLDSDNPKADEGFKELTAAYEVLSDQTQRQRYDDGEIDAAGMPIRKTRTTGYNAKGQARTKPKRPDPFAKFRRKKQEEKTVRVDGANVNYSLALKADAAVKGGTRYISMTNGKRLKVTIPKQTTNGQVLRLKGQGMPGLGGGRDGDALVTISIDGDPNFRFEGQDVHIDLPITLALAVLGGKVTTPTLSGDVSVTVPENSNSDTILRLQGKGLPADGDQAKTGDQLVTLKIMLPKKPDAELKAFVKNWAAADNIIKN